MSQQKQIFLEILNVTEKIIDMVNAQDYDNLSILVKQRAALIEHLQSFENSPLSDEIKEIKTMIMKKKQQAMALLEEKKAQSGQELKLISNNSRAIAAYKAVKYASPILFNQKDI